MSENNRFNRSAIRRHALKVSDTTRAGKFTRVSEDFIDGVITEADGVMRLLRNTDNITIGLSGIVPNGETYLTGTVKQELAAAFETQLSKIIQKKVHATRVGKTL